MYAAGLTSYPEIFPKPAPDLLSFLLTLSSGDTCGSHYLIHAKTKKKEYSARIASFESKEVTTNTENIFPNVQFNLCRNIYFFSISTGDGQHTGQSVKAVVKYQGKIGASV